ncbi:unnamed protein product [Linum trigynum]|uniref:Uncharacterized protein n=1 Tax=Linum trigynum TaxID=586398 RepID=A0AAV2E5C7_9ROSI
MKKKEEGLGGDEESWTTSEIRLMSSRGLMASSPEEETRWKMKMEGGGFPPLTYLSLAALEHPVPSGRTTDRFVGPSGSVGAGCGGQIVVFGLKSGLMELLSGSQMQEAVDREDPQNEPEIGGKWASQDSSGGTNLLRATKRDSSGFPTAGGPNFRDSLGHLLTLLLGLFFMTGIGGKKEVGFQ